MAKTFPCSLLMALFQLASSRSPFKEINSAFTFMAFVSSCSTFSVGMFSFVRALYLALFTAARFVHVCLESTHLFQVSGDGARSGRSETRRGGDDRLWRWRWLLRGTRSLTAFFNPDTVFNIRLQSASELAPALWIPIWCTSSRDLIRTTSPRWRLALYCLPFINPCLAASEQRATLICF